MFWGVKKMKKTIIAVLAIVFLASMATVSVADEKPKYLGIYIWDGTQLLSTPSEVPYNGKCNMHVIPINSPYMLTYGMDVNLDIIQFSDLEFYGNNPGNPYQKGQGHQPFAIEPISTSERIYKWNLVIKKGADERTSKGDMGCTLPDGFYKWKIVTMMHTHEVLFQVKTPQGAQQGKK